MKKVLSIVAFLALSISMMAGIHSYAPSSVLASGKWVKIRVSETGVCRMSFSEIQSAGLDPQQLRVFGYGGAQKLQDFSKPNIDDLPQVPVYVGDGYVLFWVQGSISWEYAADKGRFSHTRNTYSDYGYYFLTDNVGELLAPPFAEPVSGTPTDVTSYSDIQVHDYDSVNLIDRNGVSGGGRSFFGEQFKVSQTRSFSFSTPDAISSEKSKCMLNWQPVVRRLLLSKQTATAPVEVCPWPRFLISTPWPIREQSPYRPIRLNTNRRFPCSYRAA